MTTSLPTGLVSFLFTDVEGSTRLWEADREGMAASLALHDQIMRRQIGEHRGHVFSTAGDAFAAAFPSADEAVGAALAIQLGLLAADWPGPAVKVRMGIHTGDAEERDGDYFGPVLNRGGRIMSAGHGGQVLLSSVSADSSTLGDPARLHDLGTHHLKDLAEPEHVFEVRHDALPVVDRSIKTVDLRRSNLPDYLTSFVGRGKELGELADELAENRLVVLTGVGGTGKTRLAVEAVGAQVDDYSDGAWLIELAPITNPGLVMTTIGEPGDSGPEKVATIEDVVTRYLWSRRLVLVIDNCEHVLDSAATAIKLILDACPNVRIVATSRESLGIPGEATVRVPSLGLPDAAQTPGEAEAVLLFLDRAISVRPGFDPDESDMEAISRICTRIDGIPLGIELAAARLRSMSAPELADRIDDSFRILSGSAKTALPRQRTLAATIDWSHELLKPPERALFRRLAMFLGGFDLAAAKTVCVGHEVEDWEVIDLIDSLVDKSLVVSSHDSVHGTRLRMLEPVRQYSQERLATGGESEAIAAAHARYYAAFVREASPHTRGPEQMPWERRLDVEYDNIRGAFESMRETGAIEAYLQTGFDLFIYWAHLGMHREGIETLLAGIEGAPAGTDPKLLLKAWMVVVGLGAEITDPAAIEHGRRMLALAETMDDPNALGRAETQLAVAIRHSTTGPEYLEHLEEGRHLLEANPEPYWWEPVWETAIHNLFFAVCLPMDDARKREHIDTALELFEEAGDQALLAATLHDTVGLWGQADDAWILGNVRRSVQILSEIEVPYWYGHALMSLGALLNREEDFEGAATHLSVAIPHLEDCGDLDCWASSSRGLAHAEAELDRLDRAGDRIAAVIEKLPILPMQEVHTPRLLDLAARILQLREEPERAALVFGKAVATELPMDTIWPRGEIHELTRSALVEQLGEGEVARLGGQGVALNVDRVLKDAADWLNAG